MSVHLDRGVLLLGQNRYDLAEPEFRKALVEEPDNATAHACLALCLGQIQRHDEADREAREAIRLAPDLAFTHYVHAKLLHQRDRPAEAEQAIVRALQIDPFDADYHALKAAVQVETDRWAEALATAEAGLAIDPEHVPCANLRAMALVRLGRRDEAGQALGAALAQDPENPLSHANQGWTLLHQGNPRTALTHFSEALRLDPDLDWARAGLVEALKARNPVYRALLTYFLWMSRQSGNVRWGIILGVAFGPRLLRQIGRAYPPVAPYMAAVAIGLLVLVYLTWVTQPLFNLMLRLDPLGRHALKPDERAASNWVGVCLATALLAAVTALLLRSPLAGLTAAYAALLVIPISAAYSCPPGWVRVLGFAVAIGMAVLGATALLLAGLSEWAEPPGKATLSSLAVVCVVPFLIGVISSTWLRLLVWNGRTASA